MKISASALAMFMLVLVVRAQTIKPISQKDACEKFMPAVVRIDVADGNATGFIVSSDGWVVTAAHVVFNTDGTRRMEVAVHLPDGSVDTADTSFINKESANREIAILKVHPKGKLPALELAREEEISAGSDITIIGYPFSAESRYSPRITTKFCLSGTVAATDSVPYNGVNVDTIYFQGPAVKGISGAPLISRDTGHVVGIQSEKLAGINQALVDIRNELQNGLPPGVSVEIKLAGGAELRTSLFELINTLDRHLVNGLGSGTGAPDAAHALKQAKRDYERQHPQK